ncbi:MAG TPA: beta-hydroxyacyl-ACP dehydratase [Candidatus Parabacteroides intestinigallinarum]|uniref:Beta-hydroxyacyl-ACP dehydratase n=1 Tax=Candidatus Parabacteroides intestinigallinarum TaxID=2838722 RepID=A0A9D1XQZ6_9BACT|nr:beta-hydroxyacyl-ACP dehydratase [Candidatus Parabacteroides intestinigallinarum]
MIDVAMERLIPQRDPIRMVDRLVEVDGGTATAALSVRPDNYFMEDDGAMAEPGLIEHIAQSALALAGYRALASGAPAPPVGYIGEVRKFRCYRRPRVGEELRTSVVWGDTVGDIALVSGESRVGDERVAEVGMKISIPKNA